MTTTGDKVYVCCGDFRVWETLNTDLFEFDPDSGSSPPVHCEIKCMQPPLQNTVRWECL